MKDNVRSIAPMRKATPPSAWSEPDEQCAPDVQALRLAKLQIGASAADIASWCGVNRRQVERWLAGDRPILLAALIRSRRFYPVFSACLDELLGRRAA